MTYTNEEVDIAAWLIDHKEGLKQKIDSSHNSAYHLFPNNLYNIYIDNYVNSVVSLVKKEISASFSLNPEELNSIITAEWIKLILGPDFLYPLK